MKKLIALLLALVMVFALVACTENNEPAEENNDPAEENNDEVENNDPVEINAAVFWYNYSDNFLSTVRTALDAELEAAGIAFNNYDAQSNQATQNDQISTAISQGANLLLVNIVEMADDAAQGIVDMAKEANVPVIFFNREVADTVINSYDNACFIGTRAAEAGEMQGQLAGEYIVENFDKIDRNGDGKISYIMMKGQIGNPEAEARTSESVKFANDILVAAGKEELAYYDANNALMFQETNWMKDQAFNAMSTALGTNPMDGDAPIEVVFANNDDAAMGCIEALNAVDFNKGEGEFIPVFGVDYTPEAKAAIEAGKMVGSILQSADAMAAAIADIAGNVAAGETVFADTEGYNVDETAAKIRVPYQIMK